MFLDNQDKTLHKRTSVTICDVRIRPGTTATPPPDAFLTAVQERPALIRGGSTTMARRVMGFALLYALLLVLAPSDADGAVFNGAALRSCLSVGSAVVCPPVFNL